MPNLLSRNKHTPDDGNRGGYKEIFIFVGYFWQIPALRAKHRHYSDLEVVLGLQARNRKVEEWFYAECRRYIMDKFDEIFFDLDRKKEVVQESVIRLWVQIDDRRIRVQNGQLIRQQADGIYRPLTCSLLTFLMAIAKNEYREIVRKNREEYYAEFFSDEEHAVVLQIDWGEEEAEEQKNRIVAEQVCQLSAHCREILTQFYYENQSLDEILMIRSDHNSSKDGLKTAKNKCLNSLKDRILREFERYHLKA